MNSIRPVTTTLCIVAAILLSNGDRASAFCGFYVARADAKLFNEASQVVLARDGDHTVITMASDYQGEPREFAMVIPVPTFIEQGQIHVTDSAVVEHLDAYSAPRLVEYHDRNPCSPPPRLLLSQSVRRSASFDSRQREIRAAALGVEIEASYTVGEYDILILSARESAGLVAWLVAEGYRIPDGAESVVGGYLKQGMRFFVAKVNLGEQERLGVKRLRPIQVAYESPKFMLPIRLGMVNASGPQELFVYTLTRKGRVETTNYRTVKLPTGMDLPVYIKDEFGDFYRSMFERQVDAEDMQAVFLEYAWDMGWCDPCAAAPLSASELRQLGAYWVEKTPSSGSPMRRRQTRDVFVTRLHVRYDDAHFPEDLRFQETMDRTNFQGRYVLRHAYEGGMTCEAAGPYRESLAARREREAVALAGLTGWDFETILARVGLEDAADLAIEKARWWEGIWNEE
jgi:hypothetical protein